LIRNAFWRWIAASGIVSAVMKSSSAGGRGSSRAERGSDRKRTVANATAAGAADEVLKASDLPISVVTELGRAQIPPEKFAAVLSAFGRLPERGQYTLAARIIHVSQIYELRKLVEKQQFPLPHQQRERLNRIGASARGLLALLGVNEPKSVAGGVRRGSIHPTATTSLLMGLYRVAVERRPATATASADERLTTLILLLSDLVEAAERCALETGTQYRKGRGGQRRAGQITAEVELMQGIIASYAELRKRFPNSGPQPAFNQPLRKFVRSALKLVSASHFADLNLLKPTRITDAAIRGAFNRWRAQTKAKTAVDLNISQN
jgi:hypothetical protein